VALAIGILAGLMASAAVILVAGLADGRAHNMIASTTGVLGASTGYYTYKAMMRRQRVPEA
jgi:hypothetical protein